MNFNKSSLYTKYSISYKRYIFEITSFDERRYIITDTMKSPTDPWKIPHPLTQYDLVTKDMSLICQASLRLGLNVSTQLPILASTLAAHKLII